MKKVFINYADKTFRKQQLFSLKMAKFRGNFDKIIGYSPHDIDISFEQNYHHILSLKRGAGYWLWKPYFINRTLADLDYGDFLFYSDSGAFLINKIDLLINELQSFGQDIMGFELPLIEKQWTKKELFIKMDCFEKCYIETNQIHASFFLIKKTEFSECFFSEFLNFSSEYMNITDTFDPKINQFDNFIEHRHDQSIFSLLYKKYNLKPFKDPSQLGIHPTGYSDCENFKPYPSELRILSNGRLFRVYSYNSKYGMIIYHNKSHDPIASFIKYYLKSILSKINIYSGIVR